MSAEQLLSHVTSAAFFFILGAVALEAVRTRERLAIDAAVFFGAICTITSVSLLRRLHVIDAGELVSDLQVTLLLSLPYLQLRLVDDFGRVPRAILAGGQVLGVLSVASMFLVQRPYPALHLLAIVLGFTLVQGYCTVRLFASVRGSTGVRRGRTGALALGSAMLVVVILLAALSTFLPAEAVLWRALSTIAALACGLGYFVGFTPPRSMRRLWEEPLIRRFLATITQIRPEHTPAEVAEQMEAAVASALGTQQALISVWDADRRRLAPLREQPQAARYESTRRYLRVVQDDEPATPQDARRSLAERVFREQRALVVDDAPRDYPGDTDVHMTGAASVLLAPITLGGERFGVLSAIARRPATFARDDLALLVLFADELAGLLQRQELARAAAEMRGQAEATRLKDEFLSAAAHDLRTPLTVLLAQSQLLARRLRRTRAVTDADLDGLARLIVEASRMRRLTDNVLDASRAEATGFVTRQDTVDLRAVASDVAASVASSRHRVIVEGDDAEAWGDRERIRQVMQNLVDNAVKFSPDGGIITIQCRRSEDAAQFTVSDEGIGIPMADLPHLFQRFYRGANPGQQGFSGMGIGLFLCKRIVEEHRGKISAASVYGEGTRFCVQLPPARGLAGDQPRDQQEEGTCLSASW